MARLGEMLVSEGLLTSEQLEEALSAQKAGGGFLGQILVERKLVNESALVGLLARQTGFPQAELDRVDLDTALGEVLPESLAKRHLCVPVKRNGNLLHVAMADPTNDAAIEAIGFRTRHTVKVMVASAGAITRAWGKLYGGGAAGAGGDAGGKLTALIKDATGLAPDKRNVADAGVDLAAAGDAAPIVKLVNQLIGDAIKAAASDIHFEPQENGLTVRFRVDGALHKFAEVPSALRGYVAARVKVMCQMDVAERRFPQDGRVKVKLDDENEVDLRVSCLPSVHGEKIVMRILGRGGLKSKLDDLGLDERQLRLMQEAIRNPFGMILVTGPTGSGKTTTLYTFLQIMNQEDVNIVTAEDPVEYHLGGITQVSVRPTIGYTFDLALRAFLRQDPDIILVGEMRDYETASIAVKAALTGHFVLSTLHTNDAPSTVVRLVDMGIEPYLVASAVKLVVAQRLIRRLCPECREEGVLGPEDQESLSESEIAAIERTFKGKGCSACNGIGFKGRRAIFEVMPVRSREMKRVITEGGTEIQVEEVAAREGLSTLKDQVLRLVNTGETSLEEAYRIILSD